VNEQEKMENRNLTLTQMDMSAERRRPLDLLGRRTNELENFRSQLSAPTPLNTMLRHLPPSMLRSLVPKMKNETLLGGEYIYRPDDEVEWIYFPETTAISELQILEDGRTIEVSLTGRESAVGLPYIDLPGRSVNWVQASASGNVIKIGRDALCSEIRAHELAASTFSAAMQSYVRQISQKVACNSHHSVLERLSTWLLMLSDRCAVPQLKLTHEHIARVLGVYRPSVTCIAQEMREAGLIDYVRGNVVILDRAGLEKRCCGCYVELRSPAHGDHAFVSDNSRLSIM
jgi:CRP-like cAMP-binding protein